MANYFVNLLGNCFELLIILFFLKDKYKPKIKKQMFIPFCIIITLFQFINTNIFLTRSNLVAVGSIIFVLLILLLYRIKWRTAIILLFSIYAIIAFPEIIIGMLLSMFFDINVNYIQNNILMFATATITSKFLAYLLALITKKYLMTSTSNKIKKHLVLLLSLPVASFLVMLLFIRCCYQLNDYTFEAITLSTSVVLSFANISVFYIIDKQNDLIETKEKLLFFEKHINSQIIHYEELYKHQNELRAFRHDIQNKSILIIGLLKKGEIKKALHTMEKNINWLEENSSNIVNSGNPIIDAILQAKLHTAKAKDIHLTISTKLVDEIKIDEIELGIIIGNALDNAIEAVEQCDENTSIQFSLIVTSDRISISVRNPVKNPVDVKKLQTTKNDKINHGFGINSINTLANKYDGITIFSCENNFFTANINLSNISPDTFAS